MNPLKAVPVDRKITQPQEHSKNLEIQKLYAYDKTAFINLFGKFHFERRCIIYAMFISTIYIHYAISMSPESQFE